MPLPNPVGRQVDVLYLPAKGHVVVLGTAGSGKTTLAILRAAHVAGHPQLGGRTLLVTFNNALVRYLENIGGAELANVDVRTYHRFARGYLNSRGLMRWNCIIDGWQKLDGISAAIQEVASGAAAAPFVVRMPVEAHEEEIRWIVRQGLKTAPEYVSRRMQTPGGAPIPPEELHVMFEVYQGYLRKRALAGYEYDWDDVAVAVCDALEGDDSPRFYRHVVIDEGQDFSPEMLRSLAAAIPPDGSLTFFGDAAQQIYGSRVSWRDAGIAAPPPWLFEQNYRNTKQIVRYALAIARSRWFVGAVDLVEPREPRADGPAPTLVRCSDAAREFEFAVSTAAGFARTQTVAVLLRDHSRARAYRRALTERGVRVTKLDKDMDVWNPAPGAWVGTYYGAKGLEFDAVVMPGCGDDVIPDRDRIVAVGDEDLACSEEARLIYVGVTRARVRVVITYIGTPSRLLPLDPSVAQLVTF